MHPLHMLCMLQCFLIQAKKYGNNWNVMTYNGREKNNTFVDEWIEKAQEYGIGEIMLTSVDREGTGEGFDIELLDYVKNKSKVSIICSGGIGKEHHVAECFTHGADAVACARSFHYDEIKIEELKAYLAKKNIDIRII